MIPWGERRKKILDRYQRGTPTEFFRPRDVDSMANGGELSHNIKGTLGDLFRGFYTHFPSGIFSVSFSSGWNKKNISKLCDHLAELGWVRIVRTRFYNPKRKILRRSKSEN